MIGDSFGRDWINILLESGVGKDFNISYCQKNERTKIEYRIREAEYVFVSTNNDLDRFYPYLTKMACKKYWYVGHKGFGRCAGNYYNHTAEGYYSQTFLYDNSTNEQLQETFGKNHFIDVMGLIRLKDGSYPVFTTDSKLFSHDGIHLTQAGAKEIAKRLYVNKYLNQ